MTEEQTVQEKLSRSHLRIRCMVGLSDPKWTTDQQLEVTEYKIACLMEEHAMLLAENAKLRAALR